MRHLKYSLLTLLAAAPAAQSQFLLVPDSTSDSVALLSAADGSVVITTYIDMVALAAGANTPVEAIVVGNEIWISDQIADKLMRFSLDGTAYLGSVGGAGVLDNVRGLELVGSEVWVANDGTGGGAPGETIVRFTTAGALLGNFAVPSPFDVTNFQGDVLVPDDSGDDINRFTTLGVMLPAFHLSTGVGDVNFPEQVTVRANGNVLVAGFSRPLGIYEYDGVTGAPLNYWLTPTTNGLRGIMELGNGKLLYTNGAGVHTWDIGMLTSTLVQAGGKRYITRFAGPPVGTPYCFGDGSGTACPCTPVPLVGDPDKGCPNSFNAGGGKLSGVGFASIAADTLVLTCTTINNGGAVIFQGTNDNGGGAGMAFGDGLRCAAGNVRRMRSHAVTTNSHKYPDPSFGDNAISIRGAVLAPGDRWYQGWYRSSLAHCDPAANYNLTNGLKVTWGP